MIEQLLAAVVVAVCVVMLLRMAAGPRRTQRLDATLRRGVDACRALWRRARGRAPASRDAARQAEEAIRRARGRGAERDGNVYRPKSFRDKERK